MYPTLAYARLRALPIRSEGAKKEELIMSNKLQAKDLINVGIFTAIYFVMMFALMMLGYIPVFIPLLAALIPLVGGIPFMLFLTKVKKFGMMLIMVILICIFFLVSNAAVGVWVLSIGVICTLIAEFILKSGGYESAKKSVLAYGLFCIFQFGNYIPIYITRNAYYENLVSGYGTEYADALMRFMPDWTAPVLAIGSFVFGILGGILGRGVLKKHFQRAGIA
jgi:energy-coupling factor transport system substrate-specific component